MTKHVIIIISYVSDEICIYYSPGLSRIETCLEEMQALAYNSGVFFCTTIAFMLNLCGCEKS